MSKNENYFKKFVIRSLKDTDKKDIEKLLRIYLKDEPVSRHLKLTEEDIQILINTCFNVSLVTDFFMGIFDRETGEMSACGSASFLDNQIDAEQNADQNVKPSENLQKYLRFDAYTVSLIAKETDSDRVLVIDGCVVKPEYRGHRLVDLYTKWVIEVAKENNCDAVGGVGFVSATQNSGKRFGTVTIKDVYYKDYRDPVTGEAVLADIPSPHTRAVVSLIRLKKGSKL